MSNQFVHYVNRAASGQLPVIFIMKLMALELPSLVGLLLPLGLYIAFLITYGRWYIENEMTVLRACGYGPYALLKHTLVVAGVVAIGIAILTIWVSPYIYAERAKLLRSTGVHTLIQTIIPGRFRALEDGRLVFYVESMRKHPKIAEHLFLARQVAKNGDFQWNMLWADNGHVETDKTIDAHYVVMHQGYEIEGIPGRADYHILHFNTYKIRLPDTAPHIGDDIRTYTSEYLFRHGGPKEMAEWQWRISVPIMVFILAIIAVPLSRTNPRQGKYAKLFPAILIYLIYANFMFVVRNAIMAGKIPIWPGLFWLHGIVLLLGAFLWYREIRR